MLYALNASCRHPTHLFAISQSKVPCFELMSSITCGITTSPQFGSHTAVNFQLGLETGLKTKYLLICLILL